MKSKSGSAAVSADPKDHGKAAEKKKTSTGPVTPAKEPHSKPSGGSSAKRAKDEIDDIFSSKPAKKVAAAEKAGGGGGGVGAGADGGVGKDGGALSALAAQVKEAREKQPQGKRPKVEGSKDDIFGESAGKARKKTEEGYAIYTEDELRIGGGGGGKGGDTDLCPFDCDCCY